jgi:WD40 repeat protein
MFCVTATPPEPIFVRLLNLFDVPTRKGGGLTIAMGNGEDLESASGAMSFSPDSKTLAAEIWQQKQTIRFYDVVSRKLTRKIEDPFQTSSSRLTFSPDGNMIALSNGKAIALFPVN